MNSTRRRAANLKLTPKLPATENQTRIDRIFRVNKRPATRNEDCKEIVKKEFSKAEWLSPRVQASADFELPIKFQRLYDMFENMERVVSIEHRQEKLIKFVNMQQNVKMNLGKDFTKNHFAQMLYVYPNSYNVRIERPRVTSLYTPTNRPELVLEPNLKDDLIPYWHSKSPQKQPIHLEYAFPLGMISPTKKPKTICDYLPKSPMKSPIKTPKTTPKKTVAVLDLREKLEPWRLLCRKLIFRYKLMNRIKDAHDEFLKMLKTPEDSLAKVRRSIDSGNYHGFHPDFDSQSVADIPEAELPELLKEKSTPSSVRKFLETCSVESTPQTPKSFRKAEVDSKSTARRQLIFEDDIPQSDTPSKAMSLLERIKAKEQEAKIKEMLSDKETIERQFRLEFIKTKLLMVICSEYSLRKKSSMELPDLVNRLQTSHNSMSKTDLTEHIKLLSEVASDYFNLVPYGKTFFARLIKNDYNLILQHINLKS